MEMVADQGTETDLSMDDEKSLLLTENKVESPESVVNNGNPNHQKDKPSLVTWPTKSDLSNITDKTSAADDSTTITISSNTNSTNSLEATLNGHHIDKDSPSPNQSPTTCRIQDNPVIEIVQVSDSGENVQDVLSQSPTPRSSAEVMDVDIQEEDVIISCCASKDEEQEILTTPKNLSPSASSCSSALKKSNLRKISKYDGNNQSFNYSFTFPSCTNSLLSTPMPTPNRGLNTGDEDPTPRKRIRIVELKNDDDNGHPSIDNDDDIDLFAGGEGEGLDFDLVSGHTFQTNYNGEEMVWVSPPPAPLDFTLIHEDIVRAARVPVTKKFSVEINMHFVDGDTINNFLECKPSMITAGFFNFEQACRRRREEEEVCPMAIEPLNKYFYYENAANLKSLDEGMNFDLVSFPSKELLLDIDDEEEEKNIFYFADIWNTSKGFREYILSKSQQYLREGLMVKGFAIQDSDGCRPKDYNSSCGLLFSTFQTPKYLKDSELASLPIELIDHFNLEGGNNDKSCDICDISVSDEFIKDLLSKTDGKGVHLLVADNPACLNIHEYVREVRFQRKLYAQCIIALLGVRQGGTFVVKIFDAITLFTAGLIFLMHRCFTRLSIHKPHSSRAHTSERFLICTGKLVNPTSDEILQFLLLCHNIIMKHEEVRRIVRKKARRRLGLHSFEVKQLIPLKVIIGHADFFEFLRLQNIRFTKSLTENIQQLCASIPPDDKVTWVLNDPDSILRMKNVILNEESKEKPDFSLSSVEKACISLLKDFGLSEESNDLFQQNGLVLDKEIVQEISKSRHDWAIFSEQDCKSVMGAHPVSLFFGMGGDAICYTNGGSPSSSTASSFSPIHVEGLTLTKGTLLLATIVELIPTRLQMDDKEEDEEDVNQVQIDSIRLEFHILDGISLSGNYIGDLPYEKRMQLCETYARVMNKCKNFENLKCTVIKVRKPMVLKDEEAILSGWINSSVYIKENVFHYPGSLRLVNFPQSDSPSAMSVGGLLFYKTTGNLIENIKKRVGWDWKTAEKDDTEEESSSSNLVLMKDFISLGM